MEVAGVSAVSGLKSGQFNRKRNFEKANVEYRIMNVECRRNVFYLFYKKRINNPKKGIIPVGFRLNPGKRCIAASRVGWVEVQNPT
jgi:hypothetical protein